MSQIEVSDNVKEVLLKIQERDGHKVMDSVIRALLFSAGVMEPLTKRGSDITKYKGGD